MRKQCIMFMFSRIYGRLFLYLMNSKSDATYTRTYLLMRKQCLMFMLLLAASERAEKNPLKIKFRKDIVEWYKPLVWAEPRPISMLQNVSHLSNNHLFLPHMLLCGLGVYTRAATTSDEIIAVYSYKFRKGCRSMSTQAYTPKITSGMGA